MRFAQTDTDRIMVEMMVKGLCTDIEQELKKQVMAVIEPQIDEAIRRAAETLTTRLKVYRDIHRDAVIVDLSIDGVKVSV